MSWIIKESEKIKETTSFKWLKEKYNLKLSNLNWDGVNVPCLFNRFLFIYLFIERGYLEFIIGDIKTMKYIHYPTNYIQISKETHKEYFEKINKNAFVEVGDIDTTKYLNYYMHFIDDYLPEIFNGDFSKIESFMNPMDDFKINEINSIIQKK